MLAERNISGALAMLLYLNITIVNYTEIFSVS